MKKVSTIFLQAVIILIGLSALVFMLWEPHFEGRNVNASAVEIYFNDPFLAYAYISSIAFFVALYQAFKVLGLVRQNKTFSPATAKALRAIKYCAITLIGFIIGGGAWLLLGESDDRPPIIMIDTILTIISLSVAASATTFEQILREKS